MPTKSEKNKASEEVTAFALLAFAFSSIFYYLLVKGYVTTGTTADTFFLMWMPALAAIVTSLVYRRNISGFGWGPGEPKYLLIAYFLPIAYIALTYIPAYLGGFAGIGIVSIDPFTLIVIGTVMEIVYAAGEEIGWRGFLVPKLFDSSGSFTKTALYSGLIWAVWHYPVLLFAGPSSGVPLVWDIAGFTIQVAALAVVFAWLRLKTGSIWPCILLHASNNLFMDRLITPLITDTGITSYVVGTAGVLTCIVYAAVGLYFWSRRGEVEGNGKKAGKKK